MLQIWLGSLRKSKSIMLLDCFSTQSASETVSSATFDNPERLLQGMTWSRTSFSASAQPRAQGSPRPGSVVDPRSHCYCTSLVSAAARTRQIGALFPELAGTKALGEEERCYSFKVKRNTWTSRSAMLRVSGRDSFKTRAGIARPTTWTQNRTLWISNQICRLIYARRSSFVRIRPWNSLACWRSRDLHMTVALEPAHSCNRFPVAESQ